MAVYMDREYTGTKQIHNAEPKLQVKGQYTQEFTVFGPLLMELQFHQRGTFDSCNQYVIVHSSSVVCYFFLFKK